MLHYSAFNRDLFGYISCSHVKILDLGCGTGVFGSRLKEQVSARRVCGITYSADESIEAERRIDRVVVADLNDFNFESLNEKFDCIVCSHVLEHLYYPWTVVERLQRVLLPEGLLIVAIPNLLFYKQRLKLLRGHFKYSVKGGIMDITHFRFFDWDSTSLIYQTATSLKLVEKRAHGNFPLGPIRRFFPGMCKGIDNGWIKAFPGLFGFQFILVLKKTS